jgi:lipoprotein NlpD
LKQQHSPGFVGTLLAASIWTLTGCSSTSTPAPVFDRSADSAPAPRSVRNVPAPVAAAVPAAQPAAAARSATVAPATPGAGAAPAAILPPARLEAQPEIKPYQEGDWRPEYHVVRKGDTLYSIALDYGEDYRDLAVWNSLEDPAKIRIDQKIRLFPPAVTAETVMQQPVALPAEPATAAPVLKTGPKAQKLAYSEQALAQLSRKASPVVTILPSSAASPSASPTVPTAPASTPSAPKQKVAATPATANSSKSLPGPDSTLVWEWPTQGRLAYNFGQGTNQKGVGIEGKPGQPVLAGAPGRVVYSGSGLRGYGKLIIIKHDATYLSVYAHNSQILVKEGQTVAKGQKIAEMGSTDADRVGLHFEIRRLGKPIDPLPYLPERAS